MLNIEQVWDTGHATPYNLDADLKADFKQATGSSSVVGLRWVHGGVRHETLRYATVLPDKTGVVIVNPLKGGARNSLEVVNADGSFRFRLYPPLLDGRLDHTRAVLESPCVGWPASGISFGVPAGYRDKVASAGFGDGTFTVSVGVFLDIDWADGALRGWQVIPPHV